MSYPAGRLLCRARFERRVVADDGAGNEREAWQEAATLSCGFAPNFGARQLEADAVATGLRGVLTLHAGPSARALRAEDRLIFVAGPYKDSGPCRIVSILPRPDGATLEITIESGVAT